MASENKNENVMLTGQTAYFKKNGSMTNYGVVTSNNQEVTNTYGPGFIDEGSTVGVAVLETAQDYIDTLTDMQLYLATDFINESEDYLVKTNAENISTQLSAKNTALQNIVSHIDKYATLPYLQAINDRLDMLIPLHLKENFVLEIKSDLQPIDNEAYMLIDNGDTFQLSQNSNGIFFLNGISIGDLSHTTGTTMVISQEDGHLYIEKDATRVITEIPGFIGETDILLNTRFASRIDEIKVYGDTSVTDEIVPRYDTELRTAGLHDLQNNLWYEPTVDIKLYTMYDRVNIYSGALDLEYCPGPNTGIEIRYSQWSSQSGSTDKTIIGCGTRASISNVMTFGLQVGSSGHIYCFRGNNTNAYTDSGIQATATGRTASDKSSTYTITLNKKNDGRFTGSGAATWDKPISGTATIQNTGNATMWLCGTNDLTRYIPLQYMPSQNLIPGYSQDMNVFYIKIYEDNKLVRYLVPAQSLNGSTGMIDVLSVKMYSNKKCSFGTGNVITKLPEPID